MKKPNLENYMTLKEFDNFFEGRIYYYTEKLRKDFKKDKAKFEKTNSVNYA